MQLTSNDTLRARRVQGSTDLDQRIENLKASLRAYKEVRKSNRKAHQNNKKFYDRKAKERRFAVDDCVSVHPLDETGSDEEI